MDDTDDFWFAIQVVDGPQVLSGPHSQRDASDQRQTAIQQPNVAGKVSTVFRAPSRWQAEQNAKLYFP